MKASFEIHPIQADILMYLLFHPPSRFSEMNENKIDTDSFNFHVKSLVEEGLIEKKANLYSLTIHGKEFANRFDTEKSQIEKQAKVCVILACTKEEDGVTKYLLQERLKHPFFGYNGFPSGKISLGEKAQQTAKRELFEETGMRGDCAFAGIQHDLNYSPDKALIEDKFFYVFRITNLEGPLKENFRGGRNYWIAKDEIGTISKKFNDVVQMLDMIEKKEFFFRESTFTVDEF